MWPLIYLEETFHKEAVMEHDLKPYKVNRLDYVVRHLDKGSPVPKSYYKQYTRDMMRKLYKSRENTYGEQEIQKRVAKNKLSNDRVRHLINTDVKYAERHKARAIARDVSLHSNQTIAEVMVGDRKSVV